MSQGSHTLVRMKVRSPAPDTNATAGVSLGTGAAGRAGTTTSDDDGPVGRAVAALRRIDADMAQILRAVAEAGPVNGLPAIRLISLAAGATGWDIAYLRRVTDTLAAMPGVWTAFDRGEISWSQLRGITTAAKGLSAADRQTLDGQLSGAIVQNATAEPDRVVELAGDLAGRLDDAAQERRDRQTAQATGLRFTPNLFGGAHISGDLDDQQTAWVTDAVYGAADPSVADDQRPVDADGKPIPRVWLAPTRRAAQLAEGLTRIAMDWLAGHTTGGGPTDSYDHDGPQDAQPDGGAPIGGRRGGSGRGVRPMAMVVVDINDLTPAGQGDDTDGGVPAATARLLWRLAGGRARQSSAGVHALTCDAVRVPVLTDGDMPVAIGDAYDPIPTPVRRAAAARDQGCRFPGCDRPVQWTDLHHVNWRERGGATELSNLVSLCRTCHNLVHTHGWQMTLYDDGRLVVRRGRYRFTSRPRLRPPPPTRPPSATGHDPPAPGSPHTLPF